MHRAGNSMIETCLAMLLFELLFLFVCFDMFCVLATFSTISLSCVSIPCLISSSMNKDIRHIRLGLRFPLIRSFRSLNGMATAENSFNARR